MSGCGQNISDEIYQEPDGIYVVWLSPCKRVVSQAHSEKLRCPGFPSPQAASITVASGEKGIPVVWYNSDVVRLRHKEGKSTVAAIIYVLGL